jgi:hypothetical protein
MAKKKKYPAKIPMRETESLYLWREREREMERIKP